jgi:hypothetical protein
MRIPVFARGANPSVDRPILRKSESYCCLQVAEGRADWLDAAAHAKGIICRELLYFGPRAIPIGPADLKRVDFAEIPGVRFVYRREVNPAIAAVRVHSLQAALPEWDFSVA